MVVLDGCSWDAIARIAVNVLRQSIQAPHDPFDKQRAGDHAQQPVICALANSLSGAPLTSFTSARLLIAWPSGGVRRRRDGGVELRVVTAAGFFGERREQRLVPLGVGAFQVGHADLNVFAERLLVAAGQRERDLVRAFLQDGDWPTYMPGCSASAVSLTGSVVPSGRTTWAVTLSSVSGSCCASERRARSTTVSPSS